jgi:PAS domain S-box-containing protein
VHPRDVSQPGRSSDVQGELDRLTRRIGEVESAADGPERKDVLHDLKTAHESLRMAGEQMETLRDHLDELLAQQERAAARQTQVTAMLPVAVVTTDENGQIRDANRPATELLGVPDSAVASDTLFDFIHPDDHAGVQRALQSLLPVHGKFQRHITLDTRSQGPVDVDVYATRDQVAAHSSVTWVLMSSTAAQRREYLARALIALTRLAAVVESAEDLLPAAVQVCQAALGETVSLSLMIGDPTEPQVVASTSALAQAVDGAQVKAYEGPCATSFEQATTVVSPSLRHDERWPALRRHLVGLEVGGAVAAPLTVDDVVVGVLNAFTTPDAPPDSELVRAAELLASSVASLLQQLRTRGELEVAADDMRQALSTRAVIDQAKGIIMADKRCSADEAFQHLVDLSSRSHMKLREVATNLVVRTSSGVDNRRTVERSQSQR